MEVGLLMGAGQRGQAIVAVMVVMLILFALAGAVAIGAESLLGHRSTTTATTDDFRLRSAVNDSVAQVAGVANGCPAAPPPASPLPTPTPSPIPSSLPLALPSPDGQAGLTAKCARMDGVAADHISRVPSTGTACRTVNLRLPGPMRVAVVFDVHTSQGGWAYMDGRSGGSPLGGCPSALPSPAPEDSPCSATFDTGWTQVALICDIPSTQTAQLHLKATTTSPAQVFTAQQSPPGISPLGSAYLLQVMTPVAGNPLEETLLFVGGGSDRLLYEAPLQP